MSTLKVNRIEPRTGDTVEIVGFEAPTTPVKAWVNFDGTGSQVIVIRDSMNVSSITDNGVGDYTVNFETDMDNDNYAFVGSSANTNNRNAAVNRGYFMDIKQPDSKATVKTTSFINISTFAVAPDAYRAMCDFEENSLIIVGG